MQKDTVLKSYNNYLKKILIFVRNVVIKFYKDRCLIRASGMAYSSLLALVPLSALVFSLLTAFGAFDRLKESIQQIVFRQLLPTRHSEIIEYINIFIENTKTLGVVGLLLFTLTSVFLISNIQGNFNDIWKVSKKRNFFSQFSVYISVILITTLLVGVPFTITGWIKTTAAEITFMKINLLVQFLITFSPKILFSFTLFILLLAVPSAKVRFPGAFIGAVSGGFLMWAVKFVFAKWSTTAVRYSVIYGSIALIPIFLIWLYIIWLVILLSVEISFVWQNGGSLKNCNNRFSLFEKFRHTFELYLLIAEKYTDRSGGISEDDISRIDDFRGNYAEILFMLEELSLVYKIDNERTVFVPSSAPHVTSTDFVIKKIAGYTGCSESRFSDFYKKAEKMQIAFLSRSRGRYISDLLEKFPERVYPERDLPKDNNQHSDNCLEGVPSKDRSPSASGFNKKVP